MPKEREKTRVPQRAKEKERPRTKVASRRMERAAKASQWATRAIRVKEKVESMARRAAMCVASKAILLEIVDRWCAMLQQVLPQGPLLQIGQL